MRWKWIFLAPLAILGILLFIAIGGELVMRLWNWLLPSLFGWRQIRNGRELGAVVGLVPAPYQSGESSHDQGITRAGNRHIRRLAVQLAWSWLRYQPTSALSRWYRTRFDHGGRLRRIGIVALARKLLIAWWRYGETGVVPEGAVLKA